MEPLVHWPKTKRGRATLQRIVNAAAQVFYEKGYHGSGVGDICAAAGIASGTFYIYFESKYNLYRYMLIQCGRMVRKTIAVASKGCTTRREMEGAGMRAWLEFAAKNPYIYYIIWESLYIDKALFTDYYLHFSAAYMDQLKPARDRGEIREIDLEVLSFFFMGAANFLGLNWSMFQEAGGDVLDRVVAAYMEILDGGIFTPQAADRQGPVAQRRQTGAAPPGRFHIPLDEAGQSGG